MSRVIEAKAIISAADNTGGVFDKIAKKIEGMSKSAKAFEGMKPVSGLFKDGMFNGLKATARDMEAIEKSFRNFQSVLKGGGPMPFAKYSNAMSQWSTQTTAALRSVRIESEKTEAAQQRFMKRAGRFAGYALTTAGIGGAGYEAARGIRAGVRSAADRSREMARYSLGGMTDDEKSRANAKADEISARNPTASRTDVLAHIRQLRARLGSFDHAIDNVETLTNAQTVLGTLGKGGEHAGEDLEKLVLGLESQGVASDPAKFKSYLNSFVRAKSLFPDLTGDKFQQYMQTSNASKYGLSEDYLTTVAPTMMQHGRAPNFGVEQSSAFSALIGGRQTRQAKAAMKAAGLLGDDGRLVDEKGFVNHPYEWTRSNVKPSLQRQGISMDEEHRGDVVTAVTRMFSNRKVADYFASLLVNEGVIEKDRGQLRKAKDTDAAPQVRKEDAYQAAGAVSTQLKDAAAAFMNLSPVIKGLNELADRMSKGISAFDQDDTAGKAGKLAAGGILGAGALAGGAMAGRAGYQWLTGSALDRSAGLLDKAAIELMGAAKAIAGGKSPAGVFGDAAKAPGGPNAPTAAKSSVWSKAGDAIRTAAPAALMAGGAIAPLAMLAGGSWAASKAFPDDDESAAKRRAHSQRVRDAYRKRFADDNNRWGVTQSAGPEVTPTTTYAGSGGVGERANWGPTNVTAALTGSAEVRGEVAGKFEVTASSSLLQLVESMKNLQIGLRGQLNANGPGSTGRSSPDAAAPARPATGFNGVP